MASATLVNDVPAQSTELTEARGVWNSAPSFRGRKEPTQCSKPSLLASQALHTSVNDRDADHRSRGQSWLKLNTHRSPKFGGKSEIALSSGDE
jgi:hypothetical protein